MRTTGSVTSFFSGNHGRLGGEANSATENRLSKREHLRQCKCELNRRVRSLGFRHLDDIVSRVKPQLSEQRAKQVKNMLWESLTIGVGGVNQATVDRLLEAVESVEAGRE